MSEEMSTSPRTGVLQVPTPQSSLPVPTPDSISEPPAASPGVRVRKTEVNNPKGPFVKYVGDATQRIITPAHWGQRHPDLTSETTHVWDMKNKFAIPVSEFSEGQLDYLLIDDLQANGGHSFLEMDYNADGDLVQSHLVNHGS